MRWEAADSALPLRQCHVFRTGGDGIPCFAEELDALIGWKAEDRRLHSGIDYLTPA